MSLPINRNIVKIYTLAEQKTGYIFYVGRTTLPLCTRLSCHWTSNDPKCNPDLKEYMVYLRKKRQKPVIELVDTTTYDKRKQVEEFWIQQFSAWGFLLTNVRHKKNKNFIEPKDRPKRRCHLTEEENRMIKLLFRNGDLQLMAKMNNCSDELIRVYRNRKTIPAWLKDSLIQFYTDRAKEIHEWYLSNQKQTA